MPHVRVRFSFEGEQVKEPVIYRLGKDFPVITNIRRAQVDSDSGWVVLELEGDSASIKEGLDWVRAQGVTVASLDGDVVEGD
jgi:ABC-type methionine transport system ATPase subunit